MVFLQNFNGTFEEVAQNVRELCDTENSYDVSLSEEDVLKRKRLLNIENFTNFGFESFGKTVGFPANFVRSIMETNENLGVEIIEDRMRNYHLQKNAPFAVREFADKIAGVVSQSYTYFDDDEVMDIIETSNLKNMKFKNVLATPERFHARIIDSENPFHVEDDPSNMFFTYFIDNSMVGGSAFKVRLGVWRQACSNGLIIPVQDFVIAKRVHRGKKDIAAEFNASLALIDEKRDDIIALLNDLATAETKFNEMADDFKNEYLAKKLMVSIPESEKIINLHKLTYGGNSKWSLVNAITEFARDIKDIDRREFLETRAIKVA